MQSSSRFQSLTARLHPHAIVTSFRRSSSASSMRSSLRSRSVSNSTTQSQRSSYASAGNMSPVSTTINSIVLRQPSIVDLEEERRSFGTELDILEPRPILFFSSVEERMGSF